MNTRPLAVLFLTALTLGGRTVCAQEESAPMVLLNPADVVKADPAELRTDANTLLSVGDGIAVALASCEDAVGGCDAGVSRDELTEILTLVNDRIDKLTARHEAEPDAAVEDAVVAYVDARERYSKFLGTMDSLGTAAGGETAEPETPAAPGPSMDLDIFKDVDEPLE